MKRRSFCLMQEDYWKLINIKDFHDYKNVSEALRFCIDFTYSELCLSPKSVARDQLLTITEKNNILLRYLFIELVKMHDGTAKPLSAAAQEYLETVKREMTKQMDKKYERPSSI